MTNKKSTKRALICSILALAMCFSMLVGTTFAWFTDSVTSANNIIMSGNLDVQLYFQVEGQTDWTKVTDTTNIFKEGARWEPGHTEVVKLKVVNEGSLALKYNLGVNVASETPFENVNGETVKLSSFIKYAVIDGAQTYTRDQAVEAAENAGATALKTAYNSGTTTLDAKNDGNTDEKIVTMVVYMPTTVGNEANHKTGTTAPEINLGINLFATQAENEEDAFGSDYDADSLNKVHNAEGLQAAINAGETNITLIDNITLDKPIVIPAAPTTYSARSNEVVINLNGKTITAGLKSEGRHHYAIDNYGTVTITGNGTIEARGIENFGTMTIDGDVTIIDVDTNGGAAVWNEGTLTINNGTFKAVASDSTGGAALINKGGNVTVNGGVFSSGAKLTYAILSQNGGELTINNATVTGVHGCVGGNNTNDSVITVNGGNYTLLDNPGVSDHVLYCVTAVYGGNFKAESLDHGGQIFYESAIADGCEAFENNDGTWTVAMKEGTLNDLFTNVEDNGTVTLPQGTYTIPATVAGKTVTIEGVGDNTVIDFTKVNNVNNASITFKNLHIQGKNENIMNGFGIQRTTGHITYENCTFDGAVTNEYYGSVSYIKCTFTGTGYITTYAVKSAKFVNCTFDKADSRAVLVYSHGDNPCEVTLTDCTFKAAAKATTSAGDWTAAVEVDTTNIPTAGTSVTINNCTYDENYSNIVRDKSAAGKANAVITVDGAQVINSNDALKAAIEANVSKILLANGDYSVRFTNNTSFNVDNMTIVGMGDNVNLSVSSSEAWYGRVQGDNVTFKNVNFTSSVGATGKATYNNCTISHLECASSGSAETYVNDCEIGTFHTSVDLNSGDAYVKNSTITKAEYSGGTVMNFENCTIGELISWNTTTVLTRCQVTTIVKTHMTTNTITVDGVVVAP